MAKSALGGAGRADDRGVVGVGIVAVLVAGFVGGLLGVVVGVSLPGRLAPEATSPVAQEVTNYDAQ
jgi:hypothetical protein